MTNSPDEIPIIKLDINAYLLPQLQALDNRELQALFDQLTSQVMTPENHEYAMETSHAILREMDRRLADAMISAYSRWLEIITFIKIDTGTIITNNPDKIMCQFKTDCTEFATAKTELVSDDENVYLCDFHHGLARRFFYLFAYLPLDISKNQHGWNVEETS